jgi:hypothetical protein
MALINVIPEVSTYAVARSGTVAIRNGQGDKVLATVQPFPGYSGPLSVVMSDVDGDAILDLVAGTGAGVPAQVVAYSGAGEASFRKELARFSPFDKAFLGGVNVAAGSMDGNSGHENIVVGSGPGIESRVLIFSSLLPAVGQAPKLVGDFKPYPGQTAGVSVTVGAIEAESGLSSIITVPGPGQSATVRAYRYELENAEFCSTTSGPKKIGEFTAFDASYKGGVSLACDWTAGGEGGAQMVVVGQLAAPGEVRAYSTGSFLDGFPEMYNETPSHHLGPVSFQPVVKFTPFEAGQGVSVATTSTIAGADILVSGRAGNKGPNEVRKYKVARPKPKVAKLSATLLGKVESVAGGQGTLGGD